MSTLILDPRRTSASALSAGWIISRRDDLTWFIGSPLLGYFALAALALGLPAIPTYVIWSTLLDGPHGFATAIRTYLDKKMRHKLGWRLWLIIPLALVGPLFWLVGFGPFFTLAVLSWAQYHIAKQHVGFVMLYKRKSGERSDITLDRRFLLASLMLPWVLFISKLGSSDIWLVGLTIYLPFAALYVVRQVQNAAQGQRTNSPKLILLAVVIPLQWVALYYAGIHPAGLVVASIAIGVGHDFQYHRLTWFHNRNHYVDRSSGFASVVSRRLPYYVLSALVLSLVFGSLPRYVAQGHVILISAFACMQMMHYYLDSLIWKVRGDKELAAALRL